MSRGGRYVRVVWVLVLIALSGGCMGALEPTSKREMESRTFDHRYSLVYAAVRSVLTARGHPIIQDDQELGLLRVGWSEERYQRTQVRAKVKALGRRTTQVLLAIILEQRGAFGKKWKPAGVKLSMYEELFEEIDLQIYREYFHEVERPAREGKPIKVK